MKEVLYLGPDYQNHRGGIGAVLEVYAKHVADFRFIPTYSASSPFKRFIQYLRAVFTLMYTLATDRTIKIVHIHTASKGSFMRKSLMVMISKIFGKKVILHVHGAMFHKFYENGGILRGYIRFILKKTDALVCLSDKWKEFFGANFTLRKLVIINNVIEQPQEFPAHQNNNGHINFLFLGYIGQRKGVFDLLDVLHSNEQEFHDKYVLTVGGNGEVERLQEAISENHPKGEVKYAGWVNGSAKNQLLQDCDVYVLPSYNEGLPISVLEAMSYGKPIISTNVGGIPEIVKPGYNGWLFEAGDKKALHNILQEAMNNKPRLEEYGKHSRILSENYTPRTVFESLNVLYNQLLNE